MEPVSSAWPLLQPSRRYSNPPLSWAPSHPFLLQVGLGSGHVGAWMGALVESGIGSVLELVRDMSLELVCRATCRKKGTRRVEPRNTYYI